MLKHGGIKPPWLKQYKVLFSFYGKTNLNVKLPCGMRKALIFYIHLDSFPNRTSQPRRRTSSVSPCQVMANIACIYPIEHNLYGSQI